jgi:uncharacterized membrane protein
MSGLPLAATIAGAVCCGAMAGVFFAFSTFVMDGLTRLAPAHGIAAMQSINRAALTPPFMTLLLGTGALCLGLAAWAALSWGEPGAPWAVAGGALYLTGAIGVTRAFNIPINDAVDALAPGDARAAGDWSRYVSGWTAWNHVRTLTAAAATALLVVAVAQG